MSTISPIPKTTSGYQPFALPGSNKTAAANNHRYVRRTSPGIHATPPGQSVSALAHDIRNPLTNIDLSIEMLGAAIKDDDLKIYLDIIMRSSIRINGLVNELLKYRQADHAPAKKHSIHQLLDEVLETAEDRRMLNNISVRKEYATDDCEIALDRPKMRIALTNIIINAIESMTSKKGELKLVTKSAGTKYIIQIEDTGCGISKENLKNIFKPYFTFKPGGLGLGLATTNDILRSNHVGVFVASEEGIGTRFILMFDKNYLS